MRYTNKQRQELYNYFFKYVQDLFYFESRMWETLSIEKRNRKDLERQKKNGVKGLKFHGFKSTPTGYILKISNESNSFTFGIHGSDLKNESSLFSLFGRFEYKPNMEALKYQSVNEYSFKCNFHDSFSSNTMSEAKARIRAYISSILGGLECSH